MLTVPGVRHMISSAACVRRRSVSISSPMKRAAGVQHADHILVLDDGVLTGDATHSHLLKTCEVYKEICLSQLSKEEVEKTL